MLIEEVMLADDGIVPNNRLLPLRLYRGALASEVGRPQAALARFSRHGWGAGWVNGIYPFHHYHARAHEVLGIVGGRAEVQFGGTCGPLLGLAAGDAVLIPAGVGHCLVNGASDLVVVGSYPPGQHDYDLKRATRQNYRVAIEEIPLAQTPARDPVTGGQLVWPVMAR